MERALTADEKIRRAEEIYQRRRMNETRKTTARVNVVDTPREYKLFKKMILQIMFCLCIYFVFFLIKNGNYIFSEEFIKKAQEILSYDINFKEQYKNIMSYFEQKDNEEKEQLLQKENIANEIKNSENKVENIPNEENAIGGAESTNTPTDTLSVSEQLIEESSSISQTQTDAQEILSKYSFIKPLERNYYFKIWN